MSLKSDKLVLAVKQHMTSELEWTQEEAFAGISWMTMLIIICDKYEIPLYNPKFPDLLRTFAKLLEETIRDAKSNS